MSEIRISLDQDDFEALVRGEVVRREGVAIILKDIGFDAMRHAVDDADNQNGTDDICSECAEDPCECPT